MGKMIAIFIGSHSDVCITQDSERTSSPTSLMARNYSFRTPIENFAALLGYAEALVEGFNTIPAQSTGGEELILMLCAGTRTKLPNSGSPFW